MKKIILTCCALSAPLFSYANDWDLVTQMGPISVYFDRDSVVQDSQNSNIKNGDLLFLFDEVQPLEENGRQVSLDYLRFGHSYNCALPHQSEIVKLEGGLVSQPNNVERVPNPTLNSKQTEFDTLRWNLVCGQPLTSKPTYHGSLQGLARQNSKHIPKVPHNQNTSWSVARHTTRNLDLLNQDTLKQTSKHTYHVEFYSITNPSRTDYTVYKGELDCQNHTYTLNNLEQYNTTINKHIGALYFNYLNDKKEWTVHIQDKNNTLSSSLLNICEKPKADPQFRASITQIFSVKNGVSDKNVDPRVQRALETMTTSTPFDFQFK